MNKEFDVIIVGAGPAGSSAAYHLARAGLKVAMVDKSNLPRYKSCGGGIIARSNKYIPYDYGEVVQNYSCEALLSDLTVHKEFLITKDAPIVSMVMRDEFDHFMLKKAIEAGVVFLPEHKVTSIAKNEISLQDGKNNFKLSSTYIIGADGAFGITTRVTEHYKLVTQIPALEIELRVSTEVFAKFSKTTRFDFGIVENGYGWVFPKREHLSIGVLSFTPNKFNLNALLDDYLKLLGIDENNYKRHGFKIPILPQTNNFVYDNIFLIGDAAGFADPITLEGIGTSILSGKIAADAIIYAEHDVNAAKDRYNKLLEKQILKELRYASFLARIIYNYPKIRKFLFTHLGEVLCRQMTEVIIGNQTYSSLLSKPGNYLRLIKRLFY